MTKKHFKALTNALRFARKSTSETGEPLTLMQYRMVVDAIAQACADANPAFRYGTFEIACGYDDETE